MNKFSNAQQAFEFYYDILNSDNEVVEINKTTKLIRNLGFYIENPLDNEIKSSFRKWNKNYAEKEFNWYLSKDRSVGEIKKSAKIWDNMHNGDNIVNSNYGYQWSRNGQLDYVVAELLRDKHTRRAYLTIYDGKEHIDYKFDTPCTLNVGFNISNNKLNMNVLMRSNDIWYGFCNDQYCFSKLQQILANKVGLEVGWYFHFASDFHIYHDFLRKNNA